MTEILKKVEQYYSEKIQKYGANPRGVDWNGEESQLIRFQQLSKVISNEGFSINDIGCGYGKYSDYLEKNYRQFDYHGFDLSAEMIDSASAMFPAANFKVTENTKNIDEADYSVASGILSVKLDTSIPEWESYIYKTLDDLDKCSKVGFSFNMLTSYSDPEKMRGDLYYADPLVIFDHCKRKYSRNVALLHDYDLFEFTIIVRK